jgi:L-seryl-tRNA(Ser) seleniumtransferase
LVEIGGGFRVPDVMAQSGARLIEVGTTNRTHLRDYTAALEANEDGLPEAPIALILRAHHSNFRIVGFATEPSLAELVALGAEHGLPVMDDLGSGALLDTSQYGLAHEPTVQESVAAGAAVVCFSGDKLLGGPQCGVLLGRKDLIEVIRKHPLARAMRMDKLRLCALEETLRLLANPERIEETIPTYAMLSRPLDELRAQAEALAERIRQAQPAVRVTAREDVTYVGSGSLPARPFPSWVVVLSCPNLSASRLGLYLRQGEPPIYGRIQHDEVLLDVRTLQPGEDEEIVAALGRMEGGACGRCGAKPTLSPG